MNRKILGAWEKLGAEANPINLDSGDEEEALPPDRKKAKKLPTSVPAWLFEDQTCLFPGAGMGRVVELHGSDLACLESGEFINDTVMNFYMRHIEVNLPEEMRERCVFFNTFFYTKLTEKTKTAAGAGDSGGMYARVMTWMKGVDIFAKDFSFLPIHSGPHWTLVIICNPGLQDGDVPAILLHLDSKKGIHKPDVILTHLRAYLQHEWARLLRDGGGSNRPKQWQLENGGRPPPDFTDPLVAVSYSPAVPPQPDSSSCGLFVLAETEFFCHAAPNLKQVQDPEVMGKYWCDKHNVSLMREHIRALVVGLMYGQGAPGGLAAAGGESAAAVAAAGVLASGRGEGPRRAGRMPTSLAGQMQAAPRPSTAFQRQEMRLLCEDYASRGSTDGQRYLKPSEYFNAQAH